VLGRLPHDRPDDGALPVRVEAAEGAGHGALDLQQSDLSLPGEELLKVLEALSHGSQTMNLSSLRYPT
jgi:hypothetical protein